MKKYAITIFRLEPRTRGSKGITVWKDKHQNTPGTPLFYFSIQGITHNDIRVCLLHIESITVKKEQLFIHSRESQGLNPQRPTSQVYKGPGQLKRWHLISRPGDYINKLCSEWPSHLDPKRTQTSSGTKDSASSSP